MLSQNVIANCFSCCCAAYCPDNTATKQRLEESGLESMHSLRGICLSNEFEEPFRFLIARDEKGNIYVSFRGSSCWKEYASDLKFFQTPSMSHIGKVHNGFAQNAKLFPFEFIRNVLSNPKLLPQGSKLIFCGHSLGGAVASIVTIFANVQLQKMKKRIQCVTFGCPLFGDETFRNEVMEVDDCENICHYFTKNDVVLSLLHNLKNDILPEFFSFLDEFCFGGFTEDLSKHWTRRFGALNRGGIERLLGEFIDYVPIGLFFMFPKIDTVLKDKEVLDFLRERKSFLSMTITDFIKGLQSHTTRFYLEQLRSSLQICRIDPRRGQFNVNPDKVWDVKVGLGSGKAESSTKSSVTSKIGFVEGSHKKMKRFEVCVMGGSNLSLIKEVRIRKIEGLKCSNIFKCYGEFRARFLFSREVIDEREGETPPWAILTRDSKVKIIIRPWFGKDIERSVIVREDMDPRENISNAPFLNLLTQGMIYSVLSKKLDFQFDDVEFRRFMGFFPPCDISKQDRETRKAFHKICSILSDPEEFKKLSSTHLSVEEIKEYYGDDYKPASDEQKDEFEKSSSVEGVLNVISETEKMEDLDGRSLISISSFVVSVVLGFHSEMIKKLKYRKTWCEVGAGVTGVASTVLGFLAAGSTAIATGSVALLIFTGGLSVTTAIPFGTFAFLAGGAAVLSGAVAAGLLSYAIYLRVFLLKRISELAIESDNYLGHLYRLNKMAGNLVSEIDSESFRDLSLLQLEKRLIKYTVEKSGKRMDRLSLGDLEKRWKIWFPRKSELKLDPLYEARMLKNFIYPCYCIRKLLIRRIPCCVTVNGLKNSGKSTLLKRMWWFQTSVGQEGTKEKEYYKFEGIGDPILVIDNPGSCDACLEGHHDFVITNSDISLSHCVFGVHILCVELTHVRNSQTTDYLKYVEEAAFGLVDRYIICLNHSDSLIRQIMCELRDLDDFDLRNHQLLLKKVNHVNGEKVEEIDEEVEGEDVSSEEEDEGEETLTVKQRKELRFRIALKRIVEERQNFLETVKLGGRRVIMTCFDNEELGDIREKMKVFGIGEDECPIYSSEDVKDWILKNMKMCSSSETLSKLKVYDHRKFSRKRKKKKKKKRKKR